MRENHWKTLAMLFFSAVIVFGSSLGKDFLLLQTERKLMNQQGKIAVATPVIGWHMSTDAETETTGDMIINSKLTVGQVREALYNWNNSQYKMIHDPVEGQLSMEEAAKNAIDWLSVMKKELQVAEFDETFYSVNAVLNLGVQEKSNKEPLQAYYSFWTVRLVGKDITATLLLNAVSGEVWEAKIVLPTMDIKERTLQSLNTFAEQTGIWEAGDKAEIMLDKDCTAIKGKNGGVAEMQCTGSQQIGLYRYEYGKTMEIAEHSEYMEIVYKIWFKD